jgi:Putative zinc- or iron-chelating domain
MNVYCPALDPDTKACMIYQRRPLSCRMHLAIGDPDNCFDDVKRIHQKFAILPEVSTGLFMKLATELGTLEDDHLGVWLAELLLGVKLKSRGRTTLVAELDPPETPGPDAPRTLHLTKMVEDHEPESLTKKLRV